MWWSGGIAPDVCPVCSCARRKSPSSGACSTRRAPRRSCRCACGARTSRPASKRAGERDKRTCAAQARREESIEERAKQQAALQEKVRAQRIALRSPNRACSRSRRSATVGTRTNAKRCASRCRSSTCVQDSARREPTPSHYPDASTRARPGGTATHRRPPN